MVIRANRPTGPSAVAADAHDGSPAAGGAPSAAEASSPASAVPVATPSDLLAAPATGARFPPFLESYADMGELRRALKVLSVQLQAPYYMQHSSPQRVEARCPTWRQRKAGQGSSNPLTTQEQGAAPQQEQRPPVCDFVVAANRHANGRVYVTRAVMAHAATCPVMAARKRAGGAHAVSAAALLETARPFMEELAASATTVRPKDMAQIMKDNFGVSTSYMAAWRALSTFRQQQKQDERASYQKLAGYLTALAQSNPHSVVAFEHTSTPDSSTPSTVFARAFLAPGPLQMALRYCRPTLLLSALRGTAQFGGVVLALTAQDAMGDLVPLALGLSPAEDEAEWRFFLANAKQAFPDLTRAALAHSRGQDSPLARAIATEFPGATQSDRVDTFTSTVTQPTVAGAHVPPPGSPLAWLEVLCGKAPLMLLVGWVSKVASTLFERSDKYGRLSSEYPEEFHALARQYEREAVHFDVLRVGESAFEVVDKRSGRQRVVDFAHQRCSCGEYDAARFPCLHVFLAVSHAGLLRADVIPRIFLLTSLQALYAGRITPIDVDTVAPDGVTVPRAQPKARGRPRKVQQIQQFGDPKADKLSCSVCGVKGHNKRTCKRVTDKVGAAEQVQDTSAMQSSAPAIAGDVVAALGPMDTPGDDPDGDDSGFLAGPCTVLLMEEWLRMGVENILTLLMIVLYTDGDDLQFEHPAAALGESEQNEPVSKRRRLTTSKRGDEDEDGDEDGDEEDDEDDKKAARETGTVVV